MKRKTPLGNVLDLLDIWLDKDTIGLKHVKQIIKHTLSKEEKMYGFSCAMNGYHRCGYENGLTKINPQSFDDFFEYNYEQIGEIL